MSATARSVNLALQEPRSVLIRQPAGATPTTVESPTLATHYHTPDIHRSAAQIIRPYARSVRKTGLDQEADSPVGSQLLSHVRLPVSEADAGGSDEHQARQARQSSGRRRGQ